MPDRPPRFARARKLVGILYWSMAIGLALSVAWSATSGAYRRPAVDEQIPADSEVGGADAQGCVDALRAHHAALVTKASALLADSGGLRADVHADWQTWSAGWLEEVERTRLRCRIQPRGALAELNPMVEDLERLRLAYATAFKGFHDVARRPLRRLREAFGVEEAP